MATVLENLVAAKAALVQALANAAALEAQAVNGGPKPSYTADGKDVKWTEWRAGKLDEIAQLNKLIQNELSPFWVTSRGRS